MNHIHRFLREEFEREASDGFPRLSRVPDMLVRHFLDYFGSLGDAERSALADASTLWGTHTLAQSVIGGTTLEAVDIRVMLSSNAAWQRWSHEMMQGKSRDPYWYTPVPILRAYRSLATMRRKKNEPPPTEWDRMMEARAESVHGAKAPALRKLVRALFKERFAGRATKGDGGDWMYEGDVNGQRVRMSVDWGGSAAQLRYGLWLESNRGTLHLGRGLEGALGAGHGDWDFLTEENAAASIELLGDLIEYVSAWPRRLSSRKRAASSGL